MSRWLLIPSLLAMMLWPITLHALLFGFPIMVARNRGDQAAAVTVAVHLAVACWLWFTRGRPTPGLDPAWALVQAEKHRRQGAYFAGWGVLAALSWLLVRPEGGAGGSTVGWPVCLVVAGNLSFQPGLLGALALVVVARVKLGRRFSEPPGTGRGADQGL